MPITSIAQSHSTHSSLVCVPTLSVVTSPMIGWTSTRTVAQVRQKLPGWKCTLMPCDHSASLQIWGRYCLLCLTFYERKPKSSDRPPHFCFFSKSPWKIQSETTSSLTYGIQHSGSVVEETFCPISTGREAFYRTIHIHLIGQEVDPVADRHSPERLLPGFVQ
jgi:hypothetical protein